MPPDLPLIHHTAHLRAVPDLKPGQRAPAEVLLIHPTRMEHAHDIISAVRSGKTVVLNAAQLDPAFGQRLVDFSCGGVTAIDGDSHRLGEAVFLFAPALTRIDKG